MGKSSEELSQEPGLSTVRDILLAKDQIDSSDLDKFLDGIEGLSVSIFSSLATEAELTAAQKQRWADPQAKLFI